METQSPKSVQPFLTRYSVPRDVHPPLGGRYCPEQHLWVEEMADGNRPVVLSDTAGVRTVTKTMTVQEDDDDHFIGIPELVTKTDVQQESDDQMTCGSLLELVTKTYLEVEADDESPELF